MSHTIKPRAVFVFNRNGFEGFYVLSEDQSERLKMMQAINLLQIDIDVLSKKFVTAFDDFQKYEK